MAWVVVEADDKHSGMVTACSDDQVMQVREILGVASQHRQRLGDRQAKALEHPRPTLARGCRPARRGALEPGGERPGVDRSCSRQEVTSCRGGTVKPSGAKIGRLAAPLLLDQRLVPGHIIKGVQHEVQRNCKVASEFFRIPRVQTVDSLGDHCCSNPPALQE